MSESKDMSLPVVTVTVFENPEQSQVVVSGDLGFELNPCIVYAFASGARDIIVPNENGSAWKFYRFSPAGPLSRPAKAGDLFSYRRMSHIANYNDASGSDHYFGLEPPTPDQLKKELKALARGKKEKKTRGKTGNAKGSKVKGKTKARNIRSTS